MKEEQLPPAVASDGCDLASKFETNLKFQHKPKHHLSKILILT